MIAFIIFSVQIFFVQYAFSQAINSISSGANHGPNIASGQNIVLPNQGVPGPITNAIPTLQFGSMAPSYGQMGNTPGFSPNSFGPGISSGYGGVGNGDVTALGELPVVGTTAVTGHVPLTGAVQFTGTIPAGGIVTISGQCGCGCSGQNPAYGNLSPSYNNKQYYKFK